MARIRSVHPGQWTDVNFVSCSPHARLLAIALRNEADDRGVFIWEPLQLKMRLLPADNVDVPSLLGELVEHNLVRQFPDQSGKVYGAIRNFRRWQRPDKPKVVYPLPTELEDYAGHSPKDRDQGGGSSRPVGDGSENLSPEVTGAEGGSRGGNGRAQARGASPPRKSRLEQALEPLKALENQELQNGKH